MSSNIITPDELKRKIKEEIEKNRKDLFFNIEIKEILPPKLIIPTVRVFHMPSVSMSYESSTDRIQEIKRIDVISLIPFEFELNLDNMNTNEFSYTHLAEIIAEAYNQTEQIRLFSELKDSEISKIEKEQLSIDTFSEAIQYIGEFPTKIFKGRYYDIISLYDFLTKFEEYDLKRDIISVSGLTEYELLLLRPKNLHLIYSVPYIELNEQFCRIKSSFIIQESDKKLKEIVLFRKKVDKTQVE